MPDLLTTALNDCAIAFDLHEKKIIFISPNVNNILGYSGASFYKNPNLFNEIIDKNNRERASSLTNELSEGEWIELNYRVTTAGGEVKSVHDKRSIVADQYTGHKVLLSIISEANDKQAVSDQPHNDLSFMFDNNPNPMMIYEVPSLDILKVNKAAIERYGYSEQEFLTLNTRDLRPETEFEEFDKYIQQAGINQLESQGIIHSGIWKHQNKKGEIIYADITSQDVKFENRNCRVVVAADSTEKIRYQEEVVWTKNNLEALINNTEDQIWSVDRETRYVYMNRAYRNTVAHLTGIEPKEGDYSYRHPGVNGQEVEEWQQYYSRALKGERYTIISETVDPLTQQILYFEISFNPIYKVKGDITGVGCFASNITEQLKTEKALVDQNERLRHIASLTSHELRRPVASMLGLINIMDHGNFYNPDNKEIIEHMLTVGKEIDDVIRLIIDKTFIDELSNKYRTP